KFLPKKRMNLFQMSWDGRMNLSAGNPTRIIKMAVYADEPGLSSGKGFFLEPGGRWAIKDIPEDVVEEAQFSGYLTIQGYNSVVFEMPNGQMWAQKSNNTPADEDA